MERAADAMLNEKTEKEKDCGGLSGKLEMKHVLTKTRQTVYISPVLKCCFFPYIRLLIIPRKTTSKYWSFVHN